MKQISVFLILLLFTFHNYAQLTDDFSDGDFTNNPEWFGNTDRFRVDGEELQLYDDEDGDDSGSVPVYSPSSLYLNAATQGETTWKFRVRMDFNPSSTSYTNVYLNADVNDFGGALNGYYVAIGGTSADLIELKKQTGTSSVSLISSPADFIDMDPVDVNIKVTRDAANSWELLVDIAGGVSYTSLGTATDNDYPIGYYFGIKCAYIDSRWNEIFIDEISIDPLFVDNIPPELQTVEVVSLTETHLYFNEPLDPASAAIAANFTIDNGASIASAMIDPSDPTVVIITFDSPLVNFTDYTITSTIADAAGNPAMNTSAMFTFIMADVAAPYDMLVNEIMADPSPVVGLPDAEYIEIYNVTDNKVFDLADYQITSGSTPQQMPSYLLLPGEYVVVCDDGNLAGFTISNIVAVSSFNALTNGGDNVTISNLLDEVIHSVDFSDDCYQDPIKNDGGWSLELINVENLCDNSCTNWIASNDASGGTPGLENSVYNPEIILPELNSATVQNPMEILLVFSTTIDIADAGNPSNYSIDNGIGNPSSAMFIPPSSVLLTLDTELASATTYTVAATGIHDCLGINEIDLNNNTATFLRTENALPFDLIITEIMADPSPVVNLPEAEYIEIYNRSNKFIDLDGYDLDGKTLPSYILGPQEYVVVFDEDFITEFETFTSNIISVSSFPGLSNGGDNIELLDPSGTVINAVTYTDNWYQDATRDDGGWSLELVSPDNPCDLSQGNWRASLSDVGGTPGAENSVFTNTLDESMPGIISATPNNMESIIVYFTESLDGILASDPTSYSIDNGINIDAVTVEDPHMNAVTITLDPSTPLQVQTVYELTVATTITDCIGNPFATDSNISFALAEEIEPGDVIVNEVLFDPLPDGSDFIELYNNSNKIVNIADITIVNDATGSSPNHPILTDYLLFPQSYVVITDNPSNIAENYDVANELLLIQNTIPSLANEEGNVSLVTSLGLIDNFSYFEDYHLEFLDDTEGVSLERIDFNAESNDRNNWHSAAEGVGFATPTYENSQYLAANAQETEEYFSLTEDTFSPDNDGYKDFLQINYSIPNNGNLANIKVFDAKGRLVKDLVENQLLATEGFYQWDGVNDEGSKARIGIYVLWIEMFDIDGNVSVEKKTCVLAGQL